MENSAPIYLDTVKKIIEHFGGIQGFADATPYNYHGAADAKKRQRFPAHFHSRDIIMLSKMGITAPPELWSQVDPHFVEGTEQESVATAHD